MFQVETKGRGALVICNISNGETRSNYAEPSVKGGKFAQKRLEGRLTQPSFLWARRILERFQAIQNKQGSTMRGELCESLAFLPRRSEPWIWIAKPAKSRIKKFICGRSVPTDPLSVERPAKNSFRRRIMFSRHPSEPM